MPLCCSSKELVDMNERTATFVIVDVRDDVKQYVRYAVGRSPTVAKARSCALPFVGGEV